MTSEAPERIWAVEQPEKWGNRQGVWDTEEDGQSGETEYVLASTLAAAEERHKAEIAAAYEAAAQRAKEAIDVKAVAVPGILRALTPADATDALDAMLAKARAEGKTEWIREAVGKLQEAADDWRRTGNELPAKKIEDEIPEILTLLDEKDV